MRILLLSAYDAESHIYWRKGLVSNLDEHDWTVLSLPGRYFSWRLRGNSMTWAFSYREQLEQPYDLVIATSMTDLSALRGFVPSLANTPTIVYFHENQFAYPESDQQFSSVEPKILNLYTALAADKVVFNTEFNRRTFLEGAEALLKKLPDHVPRGLVERIQERSAVIPVPLSENCFISSDKTTDELTIIWNHRWEYDKNPQLLLDAVRVLMAKRVPFKLHVVGQQFRKIPEAFNLLKQEARPFIGEWGYIETYAAYQQLLADSDVVLSTAIHDFQGIAVLEGVAAGACPVVPDRLAYQELFDEEYRYTDEVKEAESLAFHLAHLAEIKEQGKSLVTQDIKGLCWSAQRENYRALIESFGAKTL